MKTKFYPLLLSIVAALSFSNCESNTEDIIPDPIIETPIEETPTLLTSLSFEETYAFEANLLGGPHIGMTNLTSENSLFISSRENEPSGNTTEEEVFKLNLDTNQLIRKNTSPGGFITKQLYVFGGAIFENLTEGTNKIYIYPLDNSQNYEELSMSVTADVTFVQKYGDIILIAGHKGLYVGEKTSFVGKFDTTTNIFEEIDTNLDSEGGTKAIHQMIVKDDKIFILHGHSAIGQNTQSEWSILSADLK
ncbi:MAG: hypothetical protein ACKVK2_07885 [Flavobacteriales bacterium]